MKLATLFSSFLSNRVRRSRSRAFKASPPVRKCRFESLESRLLLSADPFPIDPNSGETNLLELIDGLPLNDIESALDHFPIPYVVIAQKEGFDPVVENNRAGSPTRVDVDDSLSTGRGGHDLIVEVNTILSPTPHLELSIERIGTSNFVEDFTVLIAFPFDAFTSEVLPGQSNLFFGFQTTANDAGPGGSPGGIAPLSEVITLTTGVLGGTDHELEVNFATTGDTNPLRFFAGHFDGDATTGLLNFDGLAAWVQHVPDNITLGLDVAENLLGDPEMATSFGLTWDATSPSLVEFAFLEDETPPGGSTDYMTSLVVDEMPTHEEFSLSMQEDALTGGSLTLSHRASAPISEMTFQKVRADGLQIRATATDIPTEVDLTYEFDPTVTLDVNDDTLDLTLEVIREDGIPGSAGFFGYPLGYAAVSVTDAVDLTATWNETFDSFSVTATNPNESIGAIQVVIGDDENLELPPDPTDMSDPIFYNAAFGTDPAFPEGPYHLFSLIDDGTHGTALGRLVFVEEATLDLNADATHILHFRTSQAAPLRAYLRTTPDSHIVPLDAEVTCDIVQIPAGEVTINLDGPGQLSWDLCVGADPGESPEIDQLHCFGHIGTLFFDVDAGGLPALLTVDFVPDEYLDVLAQDCDMQPAVVGHIAVTMQDADGLDDSDGLFGEPLRLAQARVDQAPSMRAEWADSGTGTNYSFDTDETDAILGGAQFNVATVIPALLVPLLPAGAASVHYARLIDNDTEGKRLTAGVFDIDTVTFSSNDAAKTYHVSYDANSARGLEVEVDSEFGTFFSDLDIDLTLDVEDVPQVFVMDLDIDPSLNYTASGEIDEITLQGVVDNTNDGTENGTEVDFLFQGLPAQVNFNLDPDTGASLNMSDSIDLVSLELRSQDNVATIIGTSSFRLIQASLADIPAHMTADWDASDGAVGIVADTAMGEVSAVVSTSNDPSDNAAKIAPFQNGGNFDVDRSAYQKEIDDRYWPTDTQGEFDDLYGDGEQLDPDEDHFIMRGGVDFMSLQFTGFQQLSVDINATEDTLLFRAPTPEIEHPLFIGVESGGKFTTVQIDDVPDEISVDVNIAGGQINFDASSSPGQIDFYRGDLNPGDGNDATRLVINNTPSFVHISWNFGFPDGFANFDTNAPFQVLFVTQDGSSRIAAGLQMEDLQIGYDIDFPILEVETEEVLGVDVPTGDLIVGRATAGIDNGVDGMIAATGNAPVDGFFGLYKFVNNPGTLIGGTPPAPDGGEYVPELTLMLDNFKLASLTAELQIEVVPEPFKPEVEVTPSFVGNLVFDVWINAVNETFSILGFDFGYRNEFHDWRDNSPIHILPLGGGPLFGATFEFVEDAVINFVGFHDFTDHPNMLFLTADAPPTALSAGSALTRNELAGIVEYAKRLWSDEVSSERLESLDFRIVNDLPGLAVAGTVVGTDVILIDDDAAGYGWFIDPTPADDSEFQGSLVSGSGTASEHMDLLTAVMHEIGHAMGMGHHDGDLMSPTLGSGVRRVLDVGDNHASSGFSPMMTGAEHRNVGTGSVSSPGSSAISLPWGLLGTTAIATDARTTADQWAPFAAGASDKRTPRTETGSPSDVASRESWGWQTTQLTTGSAGARFTLPHYTDDPASAERQQHPASGSEIVARYASINWSGQAFGTDSGHRDIRTVEAVTQTKAPVGAWVRDFVTNLGDDPAKPANFSWSIALAASGAAPLIERAGRRENEERNPRS